MNSSFHADAFTDTYRREIGRCTATLVRVLGGVDADEETVDDTFVVAAQRWETNGFASNPGGWITTTARNKAIDRFRRESSRRRQRLDATHLDKGEIIVPPRLGDLDVVEKMINFVESFFVATRLCA